MYKFVTDKVYLKESYRICAGMVNQLVQNLKGRGIQARMAVAGSKKRGLVTQNEREAIDYDLICGLKRRKILIYGMIQGN